MSFYPNNKSRPYVAAVLVFVLLYGCTTPPPRTTKAVEEFISYLEVTDYMGYLAEATRADQDEWARMKREAEQRFNSNSTVQHRMQLALVLSTPQASESDARQGAEMLRKLGSRGGGLEPGSMEESLAHARLLEIEVRQSLLRERDALKTERTTLETECRVLATERTVLATECTALETERAALATELTKLEAERTALETERNVLHTRLNTLANRIKSLEAQLSEANEKIEGLFEIERSLEKQLQGQQN